VRELRALSIVLATLLTLVWPSSGSEARQWPPFLRASDEYPAHVANAVRRLWADATFTRTVSAEPVPVPLAFYLRFVDTPDVTAAAARHLGLTTYDVRVLGGDWYEADDGNRTHGVYHVLVRDGARRVVVSWGTHSGSLLGTIGGSALSRLEFAEDGGQATQRLMVNAIIDNGLVAGMTRPILLLFGWLVDRKLGEAFRTAAAVAQWAHAKPDAFCAWLDSAFADERRDDILKVFGECVEADRTADVRR
jgi:hypothetical protein